MAEALIEGADALLCDLDGVVYAGPEAIPGAAQAIRRSTDGGVPVVYVTNNASRAVADVAEHLTQLGLPTVGDQVMSSAQAGAQLLRERLDEGARVMVTGAQALADCVRAAGLTPVRAQQERPEAVVQGFDPSIGWADLAEAAYVLADRSILWVATNLDSTIPRDRGIAPGNGSLVAAVATAAGRRPEVAGKPEAPIFHAAARSVGAERALVVGDRLDTDILGGNRAGLQTALVLTGVDTVETALAAVTDERPDHLIQDLGGLFAPRAEVRTREAGEDLEARCGQARAVAREEAVEVHGDPDDLDAWRAACAAWWARHPQVTESAAPRVVWNTA